jgi:hypothetical protein
MPGGWRRRSSSNEVFEKSLVPGRVSPLSDPDAQIRASIIHHQDMRRPWGMQRTIPAEQLLAVLDVILTRNGSANIAARRRANGPRLRDGW